MFRGALPDSGMRFDGTAYVDRYVGDGEEPFYYSLRFVTAPPPKELEKMIVDEIALAKTRRRYFFEWKEFDIPAIDGLDTLLERKGFSLARTSRLLYAPAAFTAELSAAVEVREVHDDAEFDVLLDVNEAAFGERSDWLDQHLRMEIRRNPNQVRAYVAFVSGKPAAAAWVKIYSHIGYLFGGGTVPALRGKGAYRALVAKRAQFAQTAGAHFVLSECSPSSEKVLRRLGFTDGGKARQWVHASI